LNAALPPVLSRLRIRQWIAYVCAAVLPFVCTWVTIRTPAFHSIPFALHYACIAGVASLGGVGPPLLAIFFSFVSANYHHSIPYSQWSFTREHIERAVAMLSAAFFLIFLSWQQRRTEARLRAALESLHRQTAALINSEKLAATGRIASTIAHEVNNPLESVTNLLYLARASDTLDDTTRSYLTLAEEELARLSNITRLTLSFVRTTPVRTPVEVADVFEAVFTIFRRRCDLLSITVERDYTPGLRIDIYEHELRQVVTNLVSNAIDALSNTSLAPEPGTTRRIRIQTLPYHGNAILLVEDNGHGIELANQSQVFDAFFTTKAETGTGIGLWVTRELVEKNGGHISLASGDLTNGFRTRFRVEFPAAQPAAVEPAAVEPEPQPTP
jgi:signal transduction histidine kinase